MEELKIKYDKTKKAFARLESSLQKLETMQHSLDYDELRDSVIQRFEFCVDTLWKLLKYYIPKKTGLLIETGSPRKIFRTAVDGNIINEKEYQQFMKIIDDRNLTSHTYNEDLAKQIANKIPTYFKLMSHVLDRLAV